MQTRTKNRPFNACYARRVLALAVGGLAAQMAHAQSTWVGDVDQNWNNAANWSSDPANPTGNFIINTATGNYPIISANSAFTPVDIFVGSGAGGVGRLDHTAGTAATGNGNWMFIGVDGAGATGTYNLADTATTGGTLTGFGRGTGSLNVGRFNVGGADGATRVGTGVANINTSGTLTANAGGTLAVVLGHSAGSTGTVNMDDGTVNAVGDNAGNNGEMWVGASGNGAWNQSGGTVSSRAWLAVGRNNGGVGTLNLSGGTLNAATAVGFATIGSFAGANGTISVSGTGTFNTPRQFIVGEGGTGTLNVAGGGLVTIGHLTEGLRLGAGGTGNGTVNLNGGTIQTPIVTKGAGTGNFNFNGGTLRATQNNATFMQGLTAANVQAGGATIDSNGFNITVAQPLVGGGSGGGLTKLNGGTLTLGGPATLNGPVAVNAGKLAYTAAAPSTAGTVTVAASAGLAVKAVAADTPALSTAAISLAGPGTLEFDFNNFDTTAPIVTTNGAPLNATGTINVSLANGAFLSSGSHTLIGYNTFTGGGTFAGGPYQLTPRSTGTLLNNGTNALLLNVTANTPVWTGADGNGFWKVGTTGPNANWKLLSGGAATDYIEGDVVRFDDTATGTTTVNINTANVSPTAVAFENSAAKPYTITSTGGFGITGAAPVVKNGDGTVTFTNTNAYTGTTTINAGTIQLGDGTTDGDLTGTANVVNNGTLVFNRAGAGPFTFNKVIGGTGTVVKRGPGTQVLSGANTYTTGGTLIEGGVLSIAANNNLGANAAPVTLNGATATLRTTAGIANTHPVAVGPNGGTINVAVAGQYFFNTAETLTGSGPLTVTGGGTIAGQGVGNLRIGQTNSYSGPVTLTQGGSFEFGAANAVGPGATFNIANEGEFAVQNGVTTFNAVTVTGGTNSILSFQNGNGGNFGGTIALNANAIIGMRDWYNNATVRNGVISGPISGPGAMTVTSGTGNGGVLTLTNFNTYEGGTTIQNSRVRANESLALGSGRVTIGGTNAQLLLAPNVDIANPITVNAGAGTTAQGIVYVPDANTNATVSGPITITAAQAAGGHFGANGGTLTVTGAVTSTVPVTSRLGTVVFTNTTSAYPALAVQQGTVRLGATNAIPVGATAELGASGASLLDLAGFNQTLTGLTKAANAATVTNSAGGPSTLTLSPATTTNYAGLIKNGVGGVALAVTGGSVTLSNATGNTYAGGTTVSAGTLLAVNASGSATGPGAVGVTGTGTLGGNGTLAGPVTVAAGATIAPGTSIGTLTVGNNVTIGGTYAVELDAATSDLLAVTNLDLAAGTDAITFTTLAAPAAQTYTLATYSGTLLGQFNTVNNLPAGYAIDYGTGTNSAITLVTAIPEPTSVGLLLAAAGLAGTRRRRRPA